MRRIKAGRWLPARALDSLVHKVMAKELTPSEASPYVFSDSKSTAFYCYLGCDDTRAIKDYTIPRRATGYMVAAAAAVKCAVYMADKHKLPCYILLSVYDNSHFAAGVMTLDSDGSAQARLKMYESFPAHLGRQYIKPGMPQRARVMQQFLRDFKTGVDDVKYDDSLDYVFLGQQIDSDSCGYVTFYNLQVMVSTGEHPRPVVGAGSSRATALCDKAVAAVREAAQQVLGSAT